MGAGGVGNIELHKQSVNLNAVTPLISNDRLCSLIIQKELKQVMSCSAAAQAEPG